MTRSHLIQYTQRGGSTLAKLDVIGCQASTIESYLLKKISPVLAGAVGAGDGHPSNRYSLRFRIKTSII